MAGAGVSQPEPGDATFPVAEEVGDLVAQGALHLGGEPGGVVAEVAQQRVAVDDDLVQRVVAGRAVAVVEAVGVRLASAVEDQDGHVGEDVQQPVGQAIQRLADEPRWMWEWR